ASAAAWRALVPPDRPRLPLRDYIMLRWVREGVNNLLPVAQIGGEFVAARMMQKRGVALPFAIANAVCDLTMEMVTQIAFTLLGLVLLLWLVGDGGIAGYVAGGLVVAAGVAACFVAAQWLGLAQAMENALLWLGKMLGWGGFGQIEGLHWTLTELY